MPEFLEVTQSGSRAELVFKREKGLNILSGPVVAEIEQAWDALESDGQTRVCILSGHGKVFVAGADIKEMAQLDKEKAVEFAARGHAAFSKIENSPIVSIAALHGAALGGGCELALACDIRLAAEGLKIGQPEVNLGLIPGFGGTQRLPRVVGVGAALNMILTGEFFTAEQALQMGLVSKVTSPEALLDEARSLADVILSKGPTAVQTAKQCVRQALCLPLAEGLATEQKLFGNTFGNGEGAEGMAAFLEKRKAAF